MPCEPWLRGPMEGVSPLVAPVLYSFEQAREDLRKYTEDLTTEQVWARASGLGSVGFHLRHIAGSVDRLMTYLQGQELSGKQLEALRGEMEPGATREELLAGVEAALHDAERVVRALDVTTLTESRTVGRQHLPTTVIGLLVHIAEHTQRHVGQAICAGGRPGERDR